MESSRAHAWLVRWRFALLAAFIVHLAGAHYLVLGFTSWDGFGHRIPPAVELVQNGALVEGKFANWALQGFRPFLELIHVPFVAAFGLPGVHFSFVLTLFPLCIAAVASFTRALAGDRTAGFYAAAIYALVPFVNAQVCAGYVDWAVCGLLAFFLRTLLGVAERPDLRRGGSLVAGTFVFTMARQQAPYLATILFLVMGVLLFAKRTERAGLRTALAGFGIGILPAVALQTRTFLAHGSPIWPYELRILGLHIGEGYSIQQHPWVFGLDEYTPAVLARTTLGAWLVPLHWPSVFFDSRFLGVGLFGLLTLATAPLWRRRANRPTRVLLASCAVVSFLAKDFWSPRFAYALVLGMCVVLGLAFAALLEKPRPRALYFLALVVAGLHALRPEWDALRLQQGDFYERMNIAGSSLYMRGGGDVVLFPDMNAELVIAEAPANNFILPLYGRRLTNRVLGTVRAPAIGQYCRGLHAFDRPGRRVLVVDDGDLTKSCPRTCAAERDGRCLAYELASE